MALRRRRWRRCGVLLIPYIVIVYFINHLRILKITEKYDNTLQERNNNMDGMLGHESNTRSKIHRNDDTNVKYTSVNLKSTHLTRNIPIKSISSNVSVARNRINIASNTSNSNNVSASPCDSLPKPSHGNESQTFQRFHDKGHVFSAHYDYRENAIQVGFYSFPIIIRGWHNEEWTKGCHLLKVSLYFDSSSIVVGKGHISNTFMLALF